MVYPNENINEFLLKTKIKALKDKGFKSKEIATILSTAVNTHASLDLV